MSLSILKTTTSICFALLLLQPGRGFAETTTAVPQVDGVPCLAGQKDCKPVPHKVPANGAKAPDAATGAAPLAAAPQLPKQKPLAPVAPVTEAPDAQPKTETRPAQKPPVIATTPAPQPAPEAKPAQAATQPGTAPKPGVKPVPAPEAQPAPAITAPPPASAATGKPRPTGETATPPPGHDALGTTTGGRKRPPVAAAAAPATTAIAPTAPVVKLGVQDVRRSDQSAPDRTAAQINQPGSGLTDFEKFGLIALGAVAVGAILSDGQTVVSNSGNRVVVRDPNGHYGVMHDDNALVRRPGSTVYTQHYNDGSVLSRVVQADGTVIETVLDVNGRVLRRSVQYPNQRRVMLFNDTRPEIAYQPAYPPQRSPVIIRYSRETSRAMLLREFETPYTYWRTFSLRQVRDVPGIRGLVPQADLSTLTFDTGSSALTADQAQTLAALGGAMADLIAGNPAEVFLIEGHTDAVGDAASNLALSDARAESVALALTEMYGVPPENMITQGYGESDLALQTQFAAQANRRVVVRRITPLLATAAAN